MSGTEPEPWPEWAVRNGVTIRNCEQCQHPMGRMTRHCLEPRCKCPNHKSTLARSLTLLGIWAFVMAFALAFVVSFVTELVR